MAIKSDAGQPQEAGNHPLAVRMGVIAFVAHNVVIGSIFGTTAVLLKPMAQHMGVSLKAAAIGAPIVMAGSAVLASVAGVLAARFSLRSLLVFAGIMLTLGWVVLGFSSSYTLYLIAYGLCLGPAMAIGGSVLPPTLITRWFSSNRGLAIGIAHMSVVIAAMPKVADWVITRYGLHWAFIALAAFAALTLIPAAMCIVEYPPRPSQDPARADEAPPGQGAEVPQGPASGKGHGIGVPRLLMTGTFWALALAAAAMNTSSVVLGVHLTSMGEALGYGHDRAVTLQSIMSLAGIAGFVLFGWLADRIGGARTLAVLALDDLVLWSMFLFKLPYEAMVLVVALIGLHGAGSVPATAKAMGFSFGQASFSRAFGLSATVMLPLMVLGIVGSAAVVESTGTYTLTITGMVAFFAVAILMALLASRNAAIRPV